MKHGSLYAFSIRSILTVALLFLLIPGGVRSDDVKYLDHGVFRFGDLAGGGDPITRLRPRPSRFVVDTRTSGEFIGRRGTRLQIPPDAFVTESGRPVRGKVDLDLTEIVDAFDFATAGVDLSYQAPNGKTYFLQSAGMFHLAARKNGESLKLARGKTMRVDFPGVVPGGNFKLYHRKSGENQNWGERGIAPAPLSYDASGRLLPPGRGQDAVQNPGNPTPFEATPGELVDGDECYEGCMRVGTRTIVIDGLDWWNFDSPYPHVTCLKGRITDPDGVSKGPYQVLTIGISYKGQFARHGQPARFKINVHKERQAKVMVLDTQGNVGISDVIQTTNKNGFDKNPEGPDNYCQDIGTIPMRKFSEDVMKDPNAFQNALGLPREYYQVKYPKPGAGRPAGGGRPSTQP